MLRGLTGQMTQVVSSYSSRHFGVEILPKSSPLSPQPVAVGKEETTFTLISGKWSTIFTLPLRGMPLKQPSEETGDADACNEEKKRKEKDENFFHGKPTLKIKMSGIFFSIQ